MKTFTMLNTHETSNIRGGECIIRVDFAFPRKLNAASPGECRVECLRYLGILGFNGKMDESRYERSMADMSQCMWNGKSISFFS